jgi:hypothetical protein
VLDGQRGVVGRLGSGVAKDSVGMGVHDDAGVGTMARQRDAQSAGVGRERGGVAVAGQRVYDYDCFAL